MLIGKTNEEKIWNYLRAEGLSACGTAGLMGNLYAESGLRPNNLQNTYEKKLGYDTKGQQEQAEQETAQNHNHSAGA